MQTLSGSWLPYCNNELPLLVQPNCGEPWTEVIFADDKEGKIQVADYITAWMHMLCISLQGVLGPQILLLHMRHVSHHGALTLCSLCTAAERTFVLRDKD